MDSKQIKQAIFGVSLGIAIGLLFDSMLLLATSMWLAVFIIPVVAPVIVSAGFLGSLGWRGKLPISSWLHILLIIIVGWPLCLFGPI